MAGEVALVIGGAGGIGSATVKHLAADGWRVAVADINVEGARRVAAALGAGHRGYGGDVRDEAAVATLFASVEGELGPITALVCHTGGTSYTPQYHPRLAETSLDEWLSAEALNSRTAFLCVREFLRYRERKRVENGRIVLTSSQAGQQGGGPAGVAYGAFKAAVLGLMRTVAVEGARLGITCNAIAPGAIETSALTTTNPPDVVEAMKKRVPLRRIGQPDDIAAAVAFLVSPGAGYVTGLTLDVNGGGLMR